MKYLLDTDICVFYLRRRSSRLVKRIDDTPPADIAISAITWAEMLAGAARSQRPEETAAEQKEFFSRFTSLPFDGAAADFYAEIDSRLRSAGQLIGPLDTQIAAIAQAHDLTVGTHNTRHFERVPQLQIADWETAQATTGD